jgi:hypothetical protein
VKFLLSEKNGDDRGREIFKGIGMTFSRIVIVVCLLFLSGCAAPLTGAEMMPKAQMYDTLGSSKTLEKNISLGSILVDKNLGGPAAPVTSEQYNEALMGSLRMAGWYSLPDSARFRLDAHMTEIHQPLIGFNFTVTSKAEYTLTEKKTGKVRYNDVLTLPCTVMFSEAFNADLRMRKATACAVGENITHFLKVLSERY